jgi:hypothetical protein
VLLVQHTSFLHTNTLYPQTLAGLLLLATLDRATRPSSKPWMSADRLPVGVPDPDSATLFALPVFAV